MQQIAPTEVTADWSQFDPRAYLNEYYADLGNENLALLRFLVEVFQGLPDCQTLLDFGGGPTIYPLISAVNRVAEIHFADYLEVNLCEVRRWIERDPAAFDWTPFIAKALEIETGRPCAAPEVALRAEEIRKRVRRVLRCDASRTPPIDDLRAPYDVVLSNFCAESATSDRAQWQAYVANIASVLKPGGWLVTTALKRSTQYRVGARTFPAVDISEADLSEILEECGFPRKGIEVRSVAADRPSRDYEGLILAVAGKAPAGSRRRT